MTGSPYGTGLFKGFFDWTFPAPFNAEPRCISGSGNDDIDVGFVTAVNETATAVRICYISPNNFVATRIRVEAIGDWI